MVRSKYEKHEILLALPRVKGTNKLSITHDRVKTQVRPTFRKTQLKKMEVLRSTWIELCLSFSFLNIE